MESSVDLHKTGAIYIKRWAVVERSVPYIAQLLSFLFQAKKLLLYVVAITAYLVDEPGRNHALSPL
jgi:hypothetical protein